MVTVKIGNLLDSEAQTLVNTVNCVGVMGKGIALEFKRRFPEMFKDYAARCSAGRVQLGEPYLYRRLVPPWILNFPTKDHWRSVSRLQDIENGLRYLHEHYREWGITSLAIPPLGCGQGQLEWRVVGPAIYRYLKQFAISIELYAPFGTPHEELTPAFLDEETRLAVTADEVPPFRIPPGLFALVEILQRIEREPYHPPVGRTTFQKIAYFATQSGIPTGLKYERGSYGPYAAQLKRKISALVNNGLIHEKRLGRMFTISVGGSFHDARRAYGQDLESWQTPIDRIVDLFMRMNTDQAEVAATVHFGANEIAVEDQSRPTESDILRRVMQWKPRPRPALDPKAVALAIRHLNILGWIHASASDDLPLNEDEELLDA